MSQINNTIVQIDGEDYSLVHEPPRGSSLVELHIKNLKQSLCLESLTAELKSAAKLVYIARVGVEPAGLATRILPLETGIVNAAESAALTMLDIHGQSKSILGKITKGMHFILKGHFKIGLRKLEKCGEDAIMMADSSEKLGEEYDRLAELANGILKDTYTEKDKEKKHLEEVKENLLNYEIQVEKAEVSRNSLETQKEDLKNKYEEAREQQLKAEKKAFSVGLAGAILGAVGVGANSYADSQEQTQQSSNNIVPSSYPTSDNPTAAIQNNPQKTKQNLADQQGVAGNQANQGQGVAGNQANQGQGVAGNQANQGQGGYKDEIGAFGHAAEHAGDKLSSLEANLEKQADNYRQEKMTYYKDLLQTEKEEREALGIIAEFTVRLKGVTEEQSLTEYTINSLARAVAALRKISACLKRNATFWKKLGDKLTRLGAPDFIDDMNEVLNEDEDEDPLWYFEDETFQVDLITYYAQWHALSIISGNYEIELSNYYNEVLDDFKEYPSPQEAAQEVSEVATVLYDQVQKDLKSSKDRTKRIEAKVSAA